MLALTSPVETRYHGWPAGLKLGLLCLFTLCIFATDDLALRGGALLLVAALYLQPGTSFAREGVRLLMPLWVFLAVIAVWHGLTGTPREGFLVAAGLLAAVGAANLVTMTTRLDDMIAVVRWLLSPLRRLGLRTEPAELAIAMMVRFVPVLSGKARALVTAWRARSPRRPAWRILIPLTVLAIDDAEHVAEALRARGGVGGRPKSAMK